MGNIPAKWRFIAGKIIELNGGFCSRPRLIPGGYKSIYGIDIPVGSDCCWFVLNNALYVICVFMVSMRCNQVPFTSANFCGLIGTLLSHTIHMSDETNAHIHIYIYIICTPLSHHIILVI